MGRSAKSQAAEAVRARSKRKRVGRRSESEQGCLTGHPAFGDLVPTFELDPMPEGGGYPVRFIEKAAKEMGCTDLGLIVHLCSGSVRTLRSFDYRPPWGVRGCPDALPVTGAPASKMLAWEGEGSARRAHLVECPHDPPHPREPGSSCSVVADVRHLPIRDACVDFVMVDPPYDPEYADALWRMGKLYPTPIVLMKQCARILVPGGKVALLHHMVPILPPGMKRLKTVGVTTGPGYRIRALTIAQRTDEPLTLFDGE